MLDNPDYLLVMRYKICSNFPLHELIHFHKQKESLLGQNRDDDESHEREDGYVSNKALVTVMSARLDYMLHESSGT